VVLILYWYIAGYLLKIENQYTDMNKVKFMKSVSYRPFKIRTYAPPIRRS